MPANLSMAGIFVLIFIKSYYNDFKVIVIDELIDNFQKAVMLYNKDLSERFRIPDQQLDFNKIRKILIN
jgi:hypothetical protein